MKNESSDYMLGTVIGAALGFAFTGIGKTVKKAWQSLKPEQKDAIIEGVVEKVLPVKNNESKLSNK